MKATGLCKTVFAIPALAAGALFLAALAGCGEESLETTTGEVRVNVANAGELVPSLSSSLFSSVQEGPSFTSIPEATLALFDYEYWFKPVGGSAPASATLPTTNRNTFSLEAGTYTVRVKAFVKGSGGATHSYDEVDGANEAASGDSAQFTVTAGVMKDDDVSVTLVPVIGEGGMGYLNYSITYPERAAITEITLTPLGGTALNYTDDADSTSGPNSGFITRSGAKSGIPTGFYVFRVLLEDEEGYVAGGTGAVHIYNYLTTEIEYEFTRSNFTETLQFSQDGRVKTGLTFWDTEDELNASLSGVVLDKINEPNGYLTASVPAGYTFVAWYLNGRKQPNGIAGVSIDSVTHTITLSAAMPIGSWQLTLEATKDGWSYSKMTQFSVREGGYGDTSTFDLTTETGTGWGWRYASPVLTILDGADITVSGATKTIYIAVVKTAAVTLKGVSIILSGTAESPFDLSASAVVTLKLSGTNTLTGTGMGAGIHVPEGATLIITSIDGDGLKTGTLTATGGSSGAGIGGKYVENAGRITIQGGTVYAKGYYSPSTDDKTVLNAGAGIGGGGRNTYGSGGDFGTILITGGVVEATGGGEEGGQGSAGIGGGGGSQVLGASQGSVTIVDGTVKAQGGANAAGIGGGYALSGGNIQIEGGVITATGSGGGAGIGGGSGGGGGTILINGGRGTAQSGGVSDDASSVGPGSGGSGGTFNGGAIWPHVDPYTWGLGSLVGSYDLTERRGTGGGWTFISPVLYIEDGATVTVTGTTTIRRIVAAGTASVILSGVDINLSATSGASPLMLESGAEVTLFLSGTSTLVAGDNAAGVNAPYGTTLKITSSAGDGATSGSLAATGGVNGAGLGGGVGEDCGAIIIAGGSGQAAAGRGALSVGPGAGGDESLGTFNGESNVWPVENPYIWNGTGGPAPRFTVTFDSNGGETTAAAITVIFGQPYGVLPPAPVMPGYSFEGWWTAASGGVQIKSSSVVNLISDQTLYAHWKPLIGAFDLSQGGTGSGWKYASPVLTIEDGATVTITGSTTFRRIVVAGTATVILDGVAIDLSALSAVNPLTLGNGANLTLKLSGANTLIGGEKAAGLNVPEGSTLKITSVAGDGQTTGTLSAQGGRNGAGIGGNSEGTSGTITIAGGRILAVGGQGNGASGGGAGIGGGYLGAGGSITISGGSGSAEGKAGGKGVGPGSGGSTGGTFTGSGAVGADGWPTANPYVW